MTGAQQPPSDEELVQRLEEELKKLKVSDLLVQTLYTLSSLGYRKLSEEDRDLEQAQLAIEALRALLPVLEGAAGGDVLRDFKQVTANPLCDPALAEKALTDPTIRLKYPAAVLDCGGSAQPMLHVSPSSEHWLGTDVLGRDLYSRVIYGAQTAMLVGLGAALIATVFGIIIGVVSAYFGGTLDFIIQRFVDTLQAFPPLVLLLFQLL